MSIDVLPRQVTILCGQEKSQFLFGEIEHVTINKKKVQFTRRSEGRTEVVELRASTQQEAKACHQAIATNKQLFDKKVGSQRQPRPPRPSDELLRECLMHLEGARNKTHLMTPIKLPHTFKTEAEWRHACVWFRANTQLPPHLILVIRDNDANMTLAKLRGSGPDVLTPIICRAGGTTLEFFFETENGSRIESVEELEAGALSYSNSSSAIVVYIGEYCRVRDTPANAAAGPATAGATSSKCNLEYALYLVDFFLSIYEASSNDTLSLGTVGSGGGGAEVLSAGTGASLSLPTRSEFLSIRTLSLLKDLWLDKFPSVEPLVARTLGLLSRFLRLNPELATHLPLKDNNLAIQSTYSLFVDEYLIGKANTYSVQLQRSFEFATVLADQLLAANLFPYYDPSCYQCEHKRFQLMQQSRLDLSARQVSDLKSSDARVTAWFTPLYSTVLCLRSLLDHHSFTTDFARQAAYLETLYYFELESAHPYEAILSGILNLLLESHKCVCVCVRVCV